jgi:hypothetical protein
MKANVQDISKNAGTYGLTHVPSIFFFMYGTRQNQTATMVSAPMPKLSTNTPHNGILSK